MIYSFSGIDKNSGKKVKGKVEAQNLDDAKGKIKAKNIIYQSINKESEPLLKNVSLFSKKKISYKDLANLSRDLSIYINSGISIVNAIKLAKNQYGKSKKIALFLESVATSLDEGKDFYHALESQKVLELPEFYKQSIKVSEDSGIMDEVLDELSKLLKNQERINKQIQSSFAYPMFILTVSFMMVGFMLTYVVPKITSIFEQLNQDLPLITKIVIGTGEWFQNNWQLLAFGFLAIMIFYPVLLKISKGFKRMNDSLLLKIPIVGSIVESSELGRFAYITSILFRAGVPFVQSINLSSKILNNVIIQEAFESASEKVVEGGKLSVALNAQKYQIDKSFVQALSLGEETSEVSKILQNLSNLYFEENQDKITLFLSLLEPFLMLFVGGIIGFIVTAMLLPIFSINLG